MLRLLQKRATYMLIALVTVFAGLLFSLTAHANQEEKRETLRVGYYYLPGFNDYSRNDLPVGYNHELLERLCVYGNWKYEYIGHEDSLEKNMEMLERGEIDIIPSLTFADERLQHFDFTNNIVGMAGTNITARSDDTRFKLADFRKQKHLRIGLFKGSYRNKTFIKRAEEWGMSYTPVYFDTVKELENALLVDKSVDLLVSNSLRSLRSEIILAQFDFHGQRIAVRKGNTALRDALDKALEDMDASNPMWRRELWDKFGKQNLGDHLSFNEEELAYLAQLHKSSRVFKVLARPESTPFSFSEKGKFAGIDPDIFKEIAARLGLKYEYLQAKNRSDFDRLMTNEEADIILGLYTDYDMGEQSGYALTSPYLNMDMAMLYRKDTKGMFKRIALRQTYQGSVKELMNQIVPREAKLISYPSINACIEAVLKGEADATFVYSYTAQHQLSEDKRGVLAMKLIPGSNIGICLGISKKLSHNLASILQKTVVGVKDNFVGQYLADRLSSSPAEAGLIDLIYLHPTKSVGIIGTILLASFGGIFFYLRSRSLMLIKEQKEAIEVNNQKLTQLQKALRSGTWQISFNEDGSVQFAHWSKELLELLHIKDMEEISYSLATLRERIHPQDLSMAKKAMEDALQDVTENKEFLVTYRLLDGHNNYRWIKATGQVTRYPNGMPKLFVGLSIDISNEYNSDKVTGGLNREGFLSATDKFLGKNDIKNDYCMLFFNIKNFKAFNDLWGFDAGDRLLQDYYTRLAQSELKPVVLGRKEDHFFCLVKWQKDVLDIVEGLCSFDYLGEAAAMNVRSLCGIYLLTDAALPTEGMLDRAELAIQAIEDEYIKPYAIFDYKQREHYVDGAFVATEMRKALAEKQFKVYYQPIVECKTGKIVSAEALVRWQHPERGLISPGVFIPVMEKDGFISAVDQYVVEHVWDLYGKYIAKNMPLVPISINLSWMDFYDQKFMTWLLEHAEKQHYPEGLLRCEVTESSYAALSNNAAMLFDSFKEHHIKMLLDDFGTGVSSLNLLQKYSFDILKIDMSFTRKLGKNAKTNSILKAIIEMCHQMGLKVIAEGVETQEQLDFYKNNECDYIQGFYFYEPLPEEIFEALLFQQHHSNYIVDYHKSDELLPSSFYKGYIYFTNEEMRETANLAADTVLKLLGQNTGVGAVSGMYDERRTICFFSNLMSELLGYTKEELLELSRGSYLNLIVPADREHYLNSTEAVRSYSLLAKNGNAYRVKEIHQDVINNMGEKQWIASVRRM